MTATAPVRERWVAQWAELYDEVVTTGLCTGCAACVVSCPHDVIGYDHASGGYRPFHIEDELGPEDCVHGIKGCTSCTRACPRFRAWEVEADVALHGRRREDTEVSGIADEVLLARAASPELLAAGQDGGLVSAILVWAFEQGYIDAALVSSVDETGWKAMPAVARNRDDVLATAGSRYTYSANPLAYDDAVTGGAEKIALVGMSCQSSAVPVMKNRKIGKVGRRFALNIGLLCSKTFDDAIFEELFEAKYGLAKADIVKTNVKGVFQIWMKDGSYHEVPLKECHAWTREGCKKCPDFAAQHADISTGGIGAFGDWTLTIVRTEQGREVMGALVAAGLIETRPGSDDPGAIALMDRLSTRSRKRWPGDAADGPGILPPAAAPAPAAAPPT